MYSQRHGGTLILYRKKKTATCESDACVHVCTHVYTRESAHCGESERRIEGKPQTLQHFHPAVTDSRDPSLAGFVD